jgi:flavin reductase (DIM6/NTAB) family NADH-FMN oxidoreductase RutF
MGMTREEFRRIMGYFATGVTIMTTRQGEEVWGMTANAVTSVSLDPLLILICIDRQGVTHQFLEQAGVFALNFLKEDQEALSRAMARHENAEVRKLVNIPYRTGKTGSPLLKDCLAFLDCRIVEKCAGGDHTIFIGAVEEGGIVEDGYPLLFYKGRYHKLWR